MNTDFNASWNSFLEANPVLQIKESESFEKLTQHNWQNQLSSEEYWNQVAACFPKAGKPINLNNGAVCSSCNVVEHAYTNYYKLLNTSPSYFTWRVMEKGREVVRKGLAEIINSSLEEVAIFRNATEALNNAIFGIELSAGDEVVACKQDYAKTVSSWKQRASREGIVINWVTLTGGETNEEVVEKYEAQMSTKTKVLLLTHVINWNGQVLPIKRIIDKAVEKGIKIILDACHSFGLLELDVQLLKVDYLGTALHKWLSGPITSGMLFVRKEAIAHTWPLASSVNPKSDDIRKFEEVSIQLLPNILGLGFAIQFHNVIGRPLKEARLRHLRDYWKEQLKEIKGISFKTPIQEDQQIAMVNFCLEGWTPSGLDQELLNHQVHVNPVVWEGMEGIRITPNIYTTKEELDYFVKCIRQIALKSPISEA